MEKTYSSFPRDYGETELQFTIMFLRRCELYVLESLHSFAKMFDLLKQELEFA